MTAEQGPNLRIVKPQPPRPVHDVTAGVPDRLSSRQAARHLSDEVVAALARGGEEAAWEAAYRTYQRGLRGYLMVQLRDKDDAEEAFSETFLRAQDRIGTLRTHTADSFRSWLYRIARNVAIGRQRVRRRLVCMADPAHDEPDLLLGGFDDSVVQSEDFAAVRRAFASLDPDDQEVLWLRVVLELSSDSVAGIVGKRPGAIRMQQRRALVQLGRRLGL